MGVVGGNGADTRESSCGFPGMGEEVEGKKSEGRFVVESGGKQSNSGIGDTTALNLLGKEPGNSVGMGVLTDHIWCMRKGDGLQGSGEAPGVMVKTCGIVKTAKAHGRTYFGGGKGAAATGIRQALREHVVGVRRRK